MSEELRPCPFCGGTKICTEKGINLNYCDNCSAESNVEHWNNRPIEDALNKRIAELEEERRWIPVSEPPKVSGKYLLLNIYDDVYPCDFIAGTEIWVLPDYDTVTHWMPLPKLPEVQE